MLISKTADIIWNSRNKKHYVDHGYHFTKMGDKFSVRTDDLTNGSSAIVLVKCDYCGSEYTINWYTYNKLLSKSVINKDCCEKCCQKKAQEAVFEKYGSFSDMFFSSNDSRKRTVIERYGVENPFSNEEIKKKIISKNLEKYGVPYSQQSHVVRDKTVATCLEKYGVENYVEIFRGKFIKENSPVWKGGPIYSGDERATHECVEWRQNVFSKDHYICQCCGAHNGEGHTVVLNAHHIFNWRDYPELRFDVENGVTLCDRCHTKFHRLFGKRYNNKEQLYKFLNNPDKEIC